MKFAQCGLAQHAEITKYASLQKIHFKIPISSKNFLAKMCLMPAPLSLL
jgi:hypothetical protein